MENKNKNKPKKKKIKKNIKKIIIFMDFCLVKETF